MRDLVQRYLDSKLSRRGFATRMAGLGFTAAAAQSLLKSLDASERPAAVAEARGGTTVEGTGGELVVAQAKAAGAEYMFCNPGSMEVGLYDAFTDTPGMQLIMGLHEGVVISMADGYHKVSRRPAFVNIHVVAGTAQAGGQIYNSSRDGSALIITAGLNDNQNWSDDTILAPRPGFDQREINRQFTKISWEARNPEALALMTRRAFKVASTEPGGPVYLALAHYALEAKGVKAQVLPAERVMIRSRVRASAGAVQDAARMLIEARRPVLVVGDEVWKSGAQADLVDFAEKMGLAVAGGGIQSYANFPARHAQSLGNFSMDSEYMKNADLLVMIGSRDFGGRVTPRTPEVPPDARIIRIGIDTSDMSRNYATDLALVSDVREALNDLRSAIGSMLSKERMASASKARSEEVRAVASARRTKMDAEIRRNFGRSPMHPDELGAVMTRTIDKDAIVVTENLTGKYDSFPFGFRDNEQMRVGTTGNSLGWGIGAAMGAKLAAPDRQVVCSIGDGSVMYSASGFWSQTRHEIPILTIVWNNYNYQTVRQAYYDYKGKMATTGHYSGMYLGDPEIDFVKLAQSQGVSGEKVGAPGDLEAAIKRGVNATRDGKSYLIDAVISRYGGGADSTWYQKFSLASQRKRRV